MTSSLKKQTKRSPPSADKEYYPVFLDLKGKKCVIIGGGKVAERKCLTLIKAGAGVTVVSPEITRRLDDYKKNGLIKHLQREYRSRDIKSAFAVIVATGSIEINRKVAADAAVLNTLLNVVDNPSLCNFIVPSVLRQGALTIAVSTGGISPAMARTIRRDLENLYGADFSRYLRFLRGIRTRAMGKIKDRTKRKQLLKGIATEKMLGVLRSKGFQEAKKAVLNTWQKLRA